MEKKKVRAAAITVFGILLAVAAVLGDYTEQSEMAMLQDAMRNLKRVDNLQMAYSYAYAKDDSYGEDSVEVWADMLTGSWVGEYKTMDEDGTRLYLRQFCDGQSVYNYVDWSGEWAVQAGESTWVPNLESLTALVYRAEDILETRTWEEDGDQKISYVFTPEYLQQQHEKRYAHMRESYERYQREGASGEELYNVALSVDQYEKSRYEQIVVTYTLDPEQILRSMECTATMVAPELTPDETGRMRLGEERETKLVLRIDVQRYNQGGILNKIAQCRSELLYE